VARPPLHPCFDHPNNIRRSVQIMKLLIMHLSSACLYFIFPKSEHSLQRPVLKRPQLAFFPSCVRQSFTPIQNNRKKCNASCLNLKI
jgi:hypothetical protein